MVWTYIEKLFCSSSLENLALLCAFLHFYLIWWKELLNISLKLFEQAYSLHPKRYKFNPFVSLLPTSVARQQLSGMSLNPQAVVHTNCFFIKTQEEARKSRRKWQLDPPEIDPRCLPVEPWLTCSFSLLVFVDREGQTSATQADVGNALSNHAVDALGYV